MKDIHGSSLGLFAMLFRYTDLIPLLLCLERVFLLLLSTQNYSFKAKPFFMCMCILLVVFIASILEVLWKM